MLQGERAGQLVGLEVEAAVVEQSHVLVADFVGQHRELVLHQMGDVCESESLVLKTYYLQLFVVVVHSVVVVVVL